MFPDLRMAEASKKVLKGKIALVAGATRGAGRGIAIALGEAAHGLLHRPQFRADAPLHPAGRKRSKKLRNWSPLPAGAASPSESITLSPRK